VTYYKFNGGTHVENGVRLILYRSDDIKNYFSFNFGFRNIFECFSYFSDPLPKSVLLAFRARRNFLGNNQGSNLYSVIRQCDRAGRLLRESLKLSYSRENTDITQVKIKMIFFS
jgi:hypothetical protein